MSLAALETQITTWWHDLDGKAREDIENALTAAKAEETDVAAQVKAAAAAAKSDVLQYLQESLTENIGSRVETLEQDLIKIVARFAAQA